MMNLAGHCDPYSEGCTGLSSDIESCQSKGMKLMLSIGGGSRSYSLASSDDARQVATYIWNSFLGRQSSFLPLGNSTATLHVSTHLVILPFSKRKCFQPSRGSDKYGGVMLWSKYYDDQSGYSSSIKAGV
ncbi:ENDOCHITINASE [Salix viminalis]|uniref:ENDOCHITINASE n=1 Tax=Salix viminalis TaxID=40686 RepID=A0A9Q0NST8_SALVM|nr:ENDOCHITINASE [Salix viminalis]